MFRNYITIAFRNLMKHKSFSFINILGLSIGLTCCMLITLYIFHEYSYDEYHEKGDRLFQLNQVFINGGERNPSATVPAALTAAVEQEFPEVEESTRMLSLFMDDKTLLQYQEPGGNVISFYETSGYLTDANFFELLTYDFVEGDPTTAMGNPNTLVVNEDIAQKLFGDESALNKTITVRSSTNGDHDYTITGVFKPKATPSHIDARFFLSPRGGNMEDFFYNSTTMVNNNMFFSYLLLRNKSSAASLEQKLEPFVERTIGEELRQMGGGRELFLTHIEDIHLSKVIEENVTPTGNLTYLRILASIAVLTLLIACINFMNLSTARSSKRSVEVGVRKVLGAERRALIWQFLGESLIMAFVAFVLATIFVFLLLPFFEQVSGRNILLSWEQHGELLIVFFGFAILTGLVAGSYPAFYLSSFKPVKVLKGRFSSSLAAASLRKGLVVFQFIISVVLIIASVVIANQMDFLRSKDLGFQKDQQVVIPLRSESAKANYDVFKSKLQSNPKIQSAGASTYYPGIFNPTDWLMYREGDNAQSSKQVYINFVDDTYLQTLGLQPIAGRLYSPEFASDSISRNIILNRKGIEQFGYSSPEKAVGSWVAFDWEGEQYRYNIVGVVNDFHFKDLHVPIEAYGFVLDNSTRQNYLTAHVAKGDIGGTLSSIETTWSSLNPNEPFQYSFLDQDFQKNYQAENRLTKMIGYFTLIAILISCLGLFGLATFSAEQRIKEIGIRKVLGASVTSLVALLSLDFLKLIVIAIILASPIAWYVMREWLQTFAYRVDISWKVFAITSVVAVMIAIFTISFQAIRAAMVNPVKNLRTE